ncbi:MAG: RHS repeat-associated core domain-containing protein [Bacteroidia bacterium]
MSTPHLLPIPSFNTATGIGYGVVVSQRSGQRITSQQNFDAWGRRRNPTTWAYSNPGTRPDWLIRGFTGHEQLDVFNLIHMNARLYDPLLSRMLSPDNYVVDPDATQAYNRYSYCLNNPLKYVDPDGNEPISIIVGVAIGMYLGGSVANNSFNPGQWDYRSANTYIGIGIGGIVGGFGGAGVGSLIAKKATKTLTSAVLGGGVNAIYNYQPGQSVLGTLGYFAAGAIGSAIGADMLLGYGKTSAAMAAITSGGTANVAVGIASNRVSDAFSLAQHYAGGGLSAYTGFSAYAAATSKSSSHLLSKFDDKILSYGLQANVADFSYANSRESCLNKSFGQHFGTFVFGGLGGALHGYAMDNKFVKLSPRLNTSLILRMVAGLAAWCIFRPN